MKVKTIEQEWKAYQAEVLPKGLPKDTVNAFRRTFYHGALVMHNRVIAAGTRSDKELEQILISASAEMTRFAEEENRAAEVQ